MKSDKKSYVLRVLMNESLPKVVNAKGIYLYDDEGKKYLDSCSGRISCSLGHGIPEMGQVLKEQAETVAYVYRSAFTTEALEKAAEKVCRSTRFNMEKIFFVAGGSEATEISVKMARQYHLANKNNSKYKIISRWMSYHGGTMGALSWTGLPSQRKEYLPYLTGSYLIPPAYCYRCWFKQDPKKCDLACAEALEYEIKNQGPESIAAFMAEPISGGPLCAAVPRLDYFKRIREICDKYDVLLVLDEVMTGFGRTGKYFAYEHFDISPDIMALGKGLGGGYFPVGASALSENVADTLARNIGVFTLGHTWANNPLAAAVCCQAIDYINQNDLVPRSHKMGLYLEQKMAKMRSRHPSIGDIRGLGLMKGIEFVKDKTTKKPIEPSTNFGMILGQEAMRRGLFLLIINLHDEHYDLASDMVLFGPPLVISHEEIDEMMDLFEGSLSAAEKKAGF